MSPLEWIAVICSLVYLLLAVRNHVSCFAVGFVSSLLWAYSSWQLYNLKWDASLNLFYAIMSIYGFYAWTRGYHEAEERPITEHNLRRHSVYIVLIIVSTLAMTWGGIEVLGTSFAFWDSLTTVLSVLGTFLLTYRIMSTWVYLLIADLIYIGVYWASGAYAFSAMMVIYSVMAIAGWISWRRIKAATTLELDHTLQ